MGQCQEGGRQNGLGRGGGVAHFVAKCNFPGLRELVARHPDQEAAELGREAGLGGQVDGHRKGQALVVVGVVAHEGDPSRSASDEHGPSLTPAGDSRDDPAMAQTGRTGPLNGIKIIELAGIGPSPYTSMMLADAGAQVIRLERAVPGAPERAAEETRSHWDLLNRSRVSVGIDLKNEEAVELVLHLVEQADGLIEGFRPGVAERLGLGPEACWERNPALVYGRMTGWGQDGPMAKMAGHDIDYIAIGGALWPLGRAGTPPVPPLNLVGDFGGGGMLLAFGMVSALLEASRSGQGQVVDAAMVDGAASLMTMVHSFHEFGIWNEERGSNLLDSGAPFYEVYETSDGKFFAVGGMESKFYAELLEGIGLAGDPDFVARAERQGQLAGLEGALHRGVRHQDAGRVDSHLRRYRRLCGPGPLPVGGPPAPAQPGARDLRGS